MKVRRKDVVKIAECDPEFGRCTTCKHYQHLAVCSDCSHGNRYSFDWREYTEQHPEKFVSEGE